MEDTPATRMRLFAGARSFSRLGGARLERRVAIGDPSGFGTTPSGGVPQTVTYALGILSNAESARVCVLREWRWLCVFDRLRSIESVEK